MLGADQLYLAKSRVPAVFHVLVQKPQGDLEPLSVVRVVPCLQADLGAVDQRHVSAAHNPGARVASGIAECVKLFQIHLVQAGLLPQLPLGGILRGLVRPHKTSGQRPVPQIGVAAPLDEEQAQGALRQLTVVLLFLLQHRKNHHIRSHGGALVIPRVVPGEKFRLRQPAFIPQLRVPHLPLPPLSFSNRMSRTSVRAKPNRLVPRHLAGSAASGLLFPIPMPQMRSRGLASTRILVPVDLR